MDIAAAPVTDRARARVWGPSWRGLLLLAIAGSALVGLGFIAGARPFTGVEPIGPFIDCGPAVFGRPDPLPDPACASAYAPLPFLTFLFIGVGGVCLLWCAAALTRRAVWR